MIHGDPVILRCLPVGEARTQTLIDQFPWLPILDTAAIARQSKSADDIIRSATFPAAHAPSPDDSSRSEGSHWPCSLAALGTVGSWWACLHCCLLPVQSTPHHNPTLDFSLLAAAKAYRHLCFFPSSRCHTGVTVFCLACSQQKSSLVFLFLPYYFLLEISCTILPSPVAHNGCT